MGLNQFSRILVALIQMTSVLRRILPASSPKSEDNDDDDYSVEYSFAMEYTGSPVSHDIPHVLPVDVRRIPTATVATRAVLLNNLCLPVIQPIAQKSEGTLAIVDRIGSESNLLDEAQSANTSGALGFSDVLDESNQLSESSDVDLDEGTNVDVLNNPTTSNSIEEVEGSTDEVSGQGNTRTPVVTFRDLPSSNSVSEESDHDEPATFPERPVVPDDVKKGLCHRCHKRNRFSEKEVCIVCGAKYCSKCVLRAMGCMQEGRKCITCVGYRIDESKRGSLGKCSRMLKKMLGDDAVKQIMNSEISCEVNQLPPHLIFVNDKPLSMEELVILQSCANPPKKIRPGNYWYDKVSGFWGKVRALSHFLITKTL